MKTEFKKILRYLILWIILSYILVFYVVQRVDIYGNSMEPEYCAGDIWLADKLSYRFLPVERFDVIVFENTRRQGQYYIKRVIGLPGETVQIVDGFVYIDGMLLKDPYGSQPMERAGRAVNPVLLGEEEYFVLGDNRNDSSDSRNSNIGNVSREQIVGKTAIKIWHGRKTDYHDEKIK